MSILALHNCKKLYTTDFRNLALLGLIDWETYCVFFYLYFTIYLKNNFFPIAKIREILIAIGILASLPKRLFQKPISNEVFHPHLKRSLGSIGDDRDHSEL